MLIERLMARLRGLEPQRRIIRRCSVSQSQLISSRMAEKEARCPYCVVDDTFHRMMVLSNGRSICEKCGHIVFPHDTAFRCPCPKCLEISCSPRIRKIRRRTLGANE
jgi:predicted RNA-binding Zn-ribbon protein involved in translation (DUF1610 family)